MSNTISLPAVTDVRDAVKPGAPQVHGDVPGNIAIDWAGPAADPAASEKAVNDAFAKAAHVARITVVNQRLVVAAMEPRGATAWHDAATSVTTLRTCSQGAGPMRDALANFLKCEKGQIRVLTEDVGGAFGMKTGVYPEYTALIAAARLTGKPVHWMSSALGSLLDRQSGPRRRHRGRARARRARKISRAARAPSRQYGRLHDLCRRAACDLQFLALLSDRLSRAAYRRVGALRVHAHDADRALSRRRTPGSQLPDGAAGGRSRARHRHRPRRRLRKRNFIPRSAMPYKTDVQTTYDSGEFPAVFEKALTLADYAGFKKRKREAARRGKYRGFGISCFLEHSGGVPTEGALLEFPGGDKLVIALGVQSTGQGHATVYPRLVAEKLGISPSQVMHRHGDFFVRDQGRTGGRLALDHHGGNRDRARDRSDARESEDARGAGARSRRERHHLSQRAVRSGRHRPDDPAVHAGRARAAR